jgi:hypothetical protein
MRDSKPENLECQRVLEQYEKLQTLCTILAAIKHGEGKAWRSLTADQQDLLHEAICEILPQAISESRFLRGDWICDSCEDWFSADEPNSGIECNLCNYCAKP